MISKAPERARLDIFDRVNSGVPLSRQQMRNSLDYGKATKWLREASESTEFMQATGHSLDQKTMRDREVINRFVYSISASATTITNVLIWMAFWANPRTHE